MTTNQTYTQIKVLGRVDNTLYLFEESHKVLLPIKLPNLPLQETSWEKPSIYNTTKRIIHALGIEPNNIKIYQERNDEYFAYLELQASDRCYDINIKLEDALLVTDLSAPILVSDVVLGSKGIKISKDMIQKALADFTDQDN